ncbi:MAG: helix-turn-helix transcriptional regulator [Candidatus Krumholzibacteriota bacterium]|nr:helix-turn-helix transcriptional regulator [Candidatus Krumholzibacteriota bacterium]
MEIMELGARIKRIRKARGLTLKDIESRSQVSATHISEIERGKTSPTIGALARIAAALGKDTAFFLETENLNDVSLIKYEERDKLDFKTATGYYQRLSHGIPGGRLQAYRLHLEPGATLGYCQGNQEGEASIFCERGQVEFCANGETILLSPGDSVHFIELESHGFGNPSGTETADCILFSTRRHSVENL